MRRLAVVPLLGTLMLAGCGAVVTDEAMDACIDAGVFAQTGYSDPAPTEYAEALVQVREACATVAQNDPAWFMENYG